MCVFAETATAWCMAPQHLERISCLGMNASSPMTIARGKGRHFQIPQHPQRLSFAGAKVQNLSSPRGASTKEKPGWHFRASPGFGCASVRR
jgi:hypothetical protein